MPRLQLQQKIMIVIVAIIAVAALGITLYRFPASMKRPFVKQVVGTFKTLDQQEQENLQRLKDSDTDQDGLSDYDELYIYRTSAYNQDSDSDGIPDGVEVQQGTDPNCPLGKVCRAIIADEAQGGGSTGGTGNTSSAATGSQVTLSETKLAEAFIKAFGDLNKLTPETISAKVDVLSSGQLHEFLLGIGIPQQAIDKNTDATLRQLLKETLAEIAKAAAEGGSSATASTDKK